MPDYQGNSKRSKEVEEKVIPKKVQKVIATEVIVKKKGIGSKFKDLFVQADFKTVMASVALNVLVPAAKNMFFDAWKATGERMVFGEEAVRRRTFGTGPRITYNNPINRGYSDRSYAPRTAPPSPPQDPRSSRRSQDEIILSTREEAELVLERMNDIIENYEVVSVADLNDLLGLPQTHTDNKWGWAFLGDVQIRQIREGYLIDFPPAEPMG